MSAIFGIMRVAGQRADSACLERMSQTLAHRGLDASGLWIDQSVGLGHRMLWTTPEAVREALPLVKGQLAITADARLDNRETLIAELGYHEGEAQECGDGGLILAAYEQWGERCVTHFVGDFAFVVWDGRRRQLFCARDHFGVKPLFYHFAPGLFVFATELKGLLCLAEVPQAIDELKIAAHLTAVSDDKSRTFYKSVRKLPPGNTLIAGHDGLKIREYWALDPDLELRLRGDEEYAEAFRELFAEAVRCRLRSNARHIGSMLSGGLDSSSITCMARELLAREGTTRLHTFSAVFDHVADSDERTFQQAVLRENNVVPHRLQADGISPLTDLDKVLWHEDEACFAGNLYLHWCQYATARKQGIRVMLDGFDGDTTVSHGLGYLDELAAGAHWLKLARVVRDYSKRLQEPWLDAYRAWVWTRGLKPLVNRSGIVRRGRRLSRAVRRRVGRRTSNHGGDSKLFAFNPTFACRLNLQERSLNRFGAPGTERESHHRLLTRAILSDSLEVLDRAAAAFSLEVRYPFFDKRLVEYCLSLPPEQKMARGWTRMVMRRAMDGVLPAEIQWRTGKSDLGPGFDYGLRTFERERLNRIFTEDASVIEDYLNIESMRSIQGRFLAGQATEAEGLLMWRAVSLALWLQRTTQPQGAF